MVVVELHGVYARFNNVIALPRMQAEQTNILKETYKTMQMELYLPKCSVL